MILHIAAAAAPVVSCPTARFVTELAGPLAEIGGTLAKAFARRARALLQPVGHALFVLVMIGARTVPRAIARAITGLIVVIVAAPTRYREPSNASADHDDRHRMLAPRSEEHTSELQSLMRITYAVFCLK